MGIFLQQDNPSGRLQFFLQEPSVHHPLLLRDVSSAFPSVLGNVFVVKTYFPTTLRGTLLPASSNLLRK